MKVTRVFYPIGQGAFYWEKLEYGGHTFNVVYDCGSLQEQLVTNTIDSICSLEKAPITIDALFISHFHSDHISGIYELMSKCRVKRLFIPELNTEMLIDAYLYNVYFTQSNNNSSNQLIEKILNNEMGDTKVIPIRPDNEDPTKDEDIRTIVNPINSGKTLYINQWIYRPYNKPIPSAMRQQLFSGLGLVQTQLYTPEDVLAILKKMTVTKCKSIYQKVLKNGGFNEYSMTLFSGLRSPYRHRVYCPCYHPRFIRNITCNFLYMGDYDAKSDYNQLHNAYADVWNSISSIQVPHHGSSKNHNPLLYKTSHVGIISANPAHKRFRHPHASTLISMCMQGCFPVVVTDDITTMYMQQFYV